MATTWVLDTETKGTGATMVPLEKVLKKPAARSEPLVAPVRDRPARPRPAPAPEPRQPRRFKVVDVVTRQVLAEGAHARATVDLLKEVDSVVDVRIYTWQPKAGKWRLLSHREQKALWDFRDR